jgi:hypothetical protein
MSTTYQHNRPPRSLATAAISAAVLASATLVHAGVAIAAPAGPGTVNQMVSQLQAAGYEVIVNKVATTPLSQCTIDAIRPGQPTLEPIPVPAHQVRTMIWSPPSPDRPYTST